MRFRRKRDDSPALGDDAEAAGPATDEVVAADGAAPERTGGPYDVSEADEAVERVDLGSLLIAPEPEREVRLQVDETSNVVQSVVIAGPDGAVEVRAFAAPRGGDLWSDARRQIAAETAQHGGTATEREGRFGVELLVQQQVRMPDGRTTVQPSRIVGVNGPRWMLRATFLGRPAVEPDDAAGWEDTLASLVVSRGSQAMPPGDPLPLTLPPTARRAQ